MRVRFIISRRSNVPIQCIRSLIVWLLRFCIHFLNPYEVKGEYILEKENFPIKGVLATDFLSPTYWPKKHILH